MERAQAARRQTVDARKRDQGVGRRFVGGGQGDATSCVRVVPSDPTKYMLMQRSI